MAVSSKTELRFPNSGQMGHGEQNIHSRKSPISDEYIEKYLSEYEERGLKLKATTILKGIILIHQNQRGGSDRVRAVSG